MTTVVVFPMSRSAGCVGRVVNALADLTPEARAEFWNGRVNVTLRRLVANGVPKSQANAEISALLVEVKRVLKRRQISRERTAARRQERERLRLVDAIQPDLFGQPAAPARPAASHSTQRTEADHVA